MKRVLLSAAIALSLNVAAFEVTPAATEHSSGAQAVYIEDLTWPEVKGEIAKKLGNALVYPTMPFAPTGSRELRDGHMRFAGSVSIDTETFQAVMRQVAQSALAAGFKNVFLMGDHGWGQNALRAVAKDFENDNE